MSKRIAAGLMTVAVLSGVLAGCGSKTAKPGTGTGATTDPGSGSNAGGGQVTIEYWQYIYESKVTLMNELIKEFQDKNPNIVVKQQNFPYEQYDEKVGAAVSAGKGPDVINLYYGWLPKYVDSGFLQPLPEDAFPAATIEKEFFPLVKAAQMNGKYYVLPTAVRTLALLYNKDLFKAAGIAEPPKTWDELVTTSKALTKRDASGKLEQVGFYFNHGGQGHNWFREVLVRQTGGQPLSADNKQVQWNSPQGLQAFQWWVDLQKVHKVGEIGFMTDDVTAFKAGKAAMDVDGSFRLGNLKDVPFDFASAPLPLGPNGKPYTMASFWANGLTKKATGAQKDASIKFMKFLTQPDVMERWTKAVGELPARPEVAAKFKDDPKMKGFIDGLAYANATFFTDEAKDREAIGNAVDEVLVGGKDYKTALDGGQKKVQTLFDDFWSKHK